MGTLDLGIEEICKQSDLVIFDTCVFSPSMSNEKNSIHEYVNSVIAHQLRLMDVLSRHENVYVPRTAFDELVMKNSSVAGFRPLKASLYYLRKFLVDECRILVPSEHLDEYASLCESLYPLKDLYGLSEADFDVLLASLDSARSSNVAMVTNDRKIMISYALIREQRPLNVYSQLWSATGDYFPLSEDRLKVLECTGLAIAKRREKTEKDAIVSRILRENGIVGSVARQSAGAHPI